MRRTSYEFRGRKPLAVGEADGQPIESVSALTRRIKTVLEQAIPPTWVRGEISNFRAQASGHLYFSLKDAEAQISCVMFRGDAARGARGTDLRDGAQVLVYGELGVYEPRGNYQLIVRAAVDDGVGRLRLEFERLKARLAAEGLFAAERKRALPDMPLTIGFVTSPTGAAVQDFIRILKRRNWRGRLVVFPAKVQGEGAAAEMIQALNLAETLARSEGGPHLDLIVIGRGGGSLEDLWAFNDEALVRTIAGCAIPVISAVGHEIDFTLCDFVADERAETPSGAAELISSRFLDGIERFRQAVDGLDVLAEQQLGEEADQIEALRSKLLLLSPKGRIEQESLRLDDLSNRLTGAARHRIHELRARSAEAANRLAARSPAPALARAGERLRAVGVRFGREVFLAVADKGRALGRLGERLQALGPDAVLRRGFVIVRDAQDRPVTSAVGIKKGDRLSARFQDGSRGLVAD